MLNIMNKYLGKRYGRLVVTGYHSKAGTTHKLIFKCDCGKEKIARLSNVTSGGTKSCGCLFKEAIHAANATPGFEKGAKEHPLYGIWRSMKTRCENPKNSAYKSHGDRGIRVCERWRIGEDGLTGFQCFLEDMGERPEGDVSIERINNDGNYEPSNCEWASREVQSRNKRNNVWVILNEIEMCLHDAIKLSGVDKSGVYRRMYKGFSAQEALDYKIGKLKA